MGESVHRSLILKNALYIQRMGGAAYCNIFECTLKLPFSGDHKLWWLSQLITLLKSKLYEYENPEFILILDFRK